MVAARTRNPIGALEPEASLSNFARSQASFAWSSSSGRLGDQLTLAAVAVVTLAAKPIVVNDD